MSNNQLEAQLEIENFGQSLTVRSKFNLDKTVVYAYHELPHGRVRISTNDGFWVLNMSYEEFDTLYNEFDQRERLGVR